MNDKVKNKLLKEIVKFKEKHNISCPETVYQSDEVITSAYEFIDKLMEIIGAYDSEEGDNNE